MTRPCQDRGNGHWRRSAPNVTSSIATTVMPAGLSVWRSAKRSATVARSVSLSAPVTCSAQPIAAARTPAIRTASARERRDVSMPWLAPPAGEVGMAGAQGDRPLAPQVAHRDRAVRDLRQRAGAGVARQPARAAHGRDAVRAVGAVLAAVVAGPQAPGARAAPVLAGDARDVGATAAEAAAQV